MSERHRKVAYYPGCALEGTAHAYDRSTRAVGKKLGLDLVEVKNWNCCGAMEVKNIDPKLQTYLSSRVMSIAAQEMGMDTVMAPCNGCYHNLKKAEYDLAHDAASREVVDRLSQKAGHKTYQAGSLTTIHALDWIKEALGEDGIRMRTTRPLAGLKVANYYGCMYTRPRHIFPEKDKGEGSESTADPHFMDDILAAAGAEIVDYPLKTACCGGAHTLSELRHLDQTGAQPAGDRRGMRRRRDRHRVPDLPQRARDASGAGGEALRPQDHGGDALLYPASRPGARHRAAALGIHENVSDALPVLRAKGLR